MNYTVFTARPYLLLVQSALTSTNQQQKFLKLETRPCIQSYMSSPHCPLFQALFIPALHRAVASGRAGRVLARPLFVAISSPVFVHSFPALIVRAAIVIRRGYKNFLGSPF